jgi:OOP family OmpA-OmpF porin
VKKVVSRLLFFALLGAFAPLGHAADDTGLYLGVGAGAAKNSFNTDDFTLGNPAVAENRDEEAPGYKGFLGYRFTPNLALEAVYVNFGDFHYNYDGGAAGGSASTKYQVRTAGLAGLMTLPFSESWSLILKVGFARSEVKRTLSDTSGLLATQFAAPGTSVRSKTNNVYGGLGLEYNISKSWSLRGEYEDYGEVGDQNGTGRSKVNLTSASLVFRF